METFSTANLSVFNEGAFLERINSLQVDERLEFMDNLLIYFDDCLAVIRNHPLHFEGSGLTEVAFNILLDICNENGIEY